VPPCGIASRALTARLSSTCSSWPGSAKTGHEIGVEHRPELDVLADQPAQDRSMPPHDVAQLEQTSAAAPACG
jgi:hypothetical protein